MHKQQGFTLVELLVLISIAGILLTVGIPSLSTLIKDSRLVDTSNKLTGLVALARNEAIKQNHQTIFCVSANNESCATSGDYLIVVGDDNNNGTFESASDELIKSMSLASLDDVKIYFKTFTNQRIIFSAIGSPTQTGQLEVCDDRGSSNAKATILNMGGQMRRITPQDIGGISCS